MKNTISTTLMIFFALFFITYPMEAATFMSGSTGADGPFSPPAQVPQGTVIDSINNIVSVPLPTTGVFNFTTVNIPAGMRVKFNRNSINTPVYILTTGDVNISGTIDVNGEDGSTSAPGNIKTPVAGGKGGSGGFDGGCGGLPDYGDGNGKTLPGFGLGPSGGTPYGYWCGCNGCEYGGCQYGAGGNATTGNSLQPLIGGSGGSGGLSGDIFANGGIGGGGGGGGGAVLIASSGNINISGAVYAKGGNFGAGNYCGGGGAGGSIRLISNRISGSGMNLYAGGGLSCFITWYWYATSGANGRIRVEAYNATNLSGDVGIVFDMPRPVFLPTVPSLLITSVAGISVPAVQTGSYTSPDISISSSVGNPIPITISATNVPVGTTINVMAVPQYGPQSSTSSVLAGTDASSTATASLNISTTYPSVITAQTTFNIQTAMYFDGEKIEKVKVASSVGKEPKVTYITKSGKEIPSEIVLAGLLK